MSATIVRLMLSVITVAAAPGVWFVFLVLAVEWGGWRPFMQAFSLATIPSGLGLIIVWTLIWRTGVIWTPRRVGLTLAVVVSSVVAAIFVGILMAASFREEELAALSAAIFWAIFWLVGSVLVWKETAAERGERLRHLGIRAIACPKCGYNMTGLKQSICPECGASFTLDELFAALKEDKGSLPEETRA